MSTQKLFEKELPFLAALVSLENKSFGSGIFILEGSEVYFSTARHVLFTEKINKETKTKSFVIKKKSIEILYYPKRAGFKNQEILTIDLEVLFKAKKLSINSPQDICVFKIGEVVDKKIQIEKGVSIKTGNLSLNVASSSMVKEYKNIHVGDDLFVIGYPKALGLKNNEQYDFNLPLVRSGIIGGKNDVKETLIIDSPVFGGNSGGPVFIVENDLEIVDGKLVSKNKKYLIGIVSQFIPWMNRANKTTVLMENSGYGVVVPFEKIIQLIRSLKKSEES